MRDRIPNHTVTAFIKPALPTSEKLHHTPQHDPGDSKLHKHHAPKLLSNKEIEKQMDYRFPTPQSIYTCNTSLEQFPATLEIVYS